MRRWLKKTSIRFAIVFLLIIAIAAAVTWWPAHKAKQMIIQQQRLSGQAVSQLQQAQNFLNSLPTLDDNNIRKQGAMKFYANQAGRVSAQFNGLTITRPPNLQPLFGVSTDGEYKVIKDVNFTLSQIRQKTVYTSTRNDTNKAAKLMAYHAAVSAALVNVLEYDPVADTQDFNLKSPDTQQRLKLAHDGLIKTDQQLQAAKKLYTDSSIDEVTALISGLRYDRFQLSQTGNTGAWVKAFEGAQTKIIQNRIAFWHSAPRAIKSKLAQDQYQMAMVNNLWQTDAQKYNLN